MEKSNEKIADKLLEKVRDGDKEAFHELEQLAETGNARAMSNLAEIYLKGFGVVEISYKKALELFRKASTFNEVYALFSLGRFYRDAKYGFEQDGHKAAEYFIKAAENATPEGATKLLNLAAEIYHYGKGCVAPDGQKAVELYEKLAEMESRLAGNKSLLKLAEIYTEGCGEIKSDAQKAIEYLNSLGAHYELAEFYREGKAGLKPDGYKVIEHLSKLGFRHMKSIAEIYRDGKYNVKADGNKAIEYLLKKSECNFNTLEEVAEVYLKRENKFDYNEHNDAIEYCVEAQEFCNVDVFQEVAKIYLEGKGGVQIDGYKALEYFSKAAEGIANIINFTKEFIENNNDIKQKRQGLFKCVFLWLERISENISEQIAKIYNDGKAGVEPNPQKAIEYLLKHEAAMYSGFNDETNTSRAEVFKNIAEIYFKLGDGQKALEYFIKADEFGDEWAYINVAMIYRDGKGKLKPDGLKLIEYLTKKLEQKESPDDSIIYEIAQAYEEGCGNLKPDAQKALEFYRKAAEFGYLGG